MHVKLSGSRYFIRPSFLILSGLIVIGVAVLTVHARKPELLSTSDTKNTSATISTTLKDTTKTLPATDSATPADSLQGQGSIASVAGSSSSSTMPAPSEPNTGMAGATSSAGRGSGSSSGCTLDLTSRTKRYNEDIKKAKTDLDNSLGFPTVGSMISIEYVVDYNDKVTKLFGKYKTDLETNHCQLQVKTAPLLSSTYPN